MMARRLSAPAAIAAALLTGFAARAQETAHYVSVNDIELAWDGVIIPVYEYVDVVLGPDGKGTIEVGFQHYGTSALDMLSLLAGSAYLNEPSIDPMDLGEFDIDALRRVVMTGTVLVSPGRIVWEPEMLAPTAPEGLRAGGVEAHVSPFRVVPGMSGVQRNGGNETDLGDGFTLVMDGVSHDYRRDVPGLWQLTTYLAYLTEQSIVFTAVCYAPIAQAYLDGDTHRFGEGAIAELEAIAADRPGLALLRERGYGEALSHFLDAALEARSVLNAWVADEIDREGLDFVMGALISFLDDPAPAQQDWATRATTMARLIEEMHVLPGDADFPDDPLAGFDALLQTQVDRYETDPWATTGPWTSAYAGGGWATLILLLLAFECAP